MSVNYRSFSNLRLITLLCAGNFLVAFANGTLLHFEQHEQKRDPSLFEISIGHVGDKINIERVNDFIHNPLLALLVGTMVGLAFIKLMPRRWTPWASGLASVAAVVTSALLLWCYSSHSVCAKTGVVKTDGHDWLFFPLLCMRFGLSFASRGFRSDVAAGHKRKIGWVELTYSTGMILGFVLWARYTPILLNNFEVVLFFDLIFLLTAAVLDLLSNPNVLYKAVVVKPEAKPRQEPWDNRPQYVAAAVIAMSLTVGIQIVAFAFHRADEQYLMHYVLPGFYFGAAVASLIYGSFVKVELSWPRASQGRRLFGMPLIGLGERGRHFSLGWVAALATAVLVLAILSHWQFHPPFITVVLLIASAAFLFEIIALSLFKWVGEEAGKTNREGLVAMMMGGMGVGGTISLYFLSIPHETTVPSHARYVGWVVTSVVCLVVATLAVPLAALLQKPRSKRDGPSGGAHATAVISLSSPGLQIHAPSGETAAARVDA